MKRTSVVTGRPIYNHPEKDGFANEVFLSADSSDTIESPQLVAARQLLTSLSAAAVNWSKLNTAFLNMFNTGTYDAQSSTGGYSFTPVPLSISTAQGVSIDKNMANLAASGASNVQNWHAMADYAPAISKMTGDAATALKNQQALVDKLTQQVVSTNPTLIAAQSAATVQQKAADAKASNTKYFVIGGIAIAVISAIGAIVYFTKHKK